MSIAKSLDSTLDDAKTRILSDPQLREQYYQEHQRTVKERLAHEANVESDEDRETRRRALWQRLDYDPAAAEESLKEKVEKLVSEHSLKRRAGWEEGKRLEQ